MNGGRKLRRVAAVLAVTLIPAVPAVAQLPETPQVSVPPVNVPDVPATPVTPPIQTPDVPAVNTPDLPPLQPPSQPAPAPAADPDPEPAPSPQPSAPQSSPDPAPQQDVKGTNEESAPDSAPQHQSGDADGQYDEATSASTRGSGTTSGSRSTTEVEAARDIARAKRTWATDSTPVDDMPRLDPTVFAETETPRRVARSKKAPVATTGPAAEGWSAPLAPLLLLIAASAAGLMALVVVRLRQTLPHGDTGAAGGSSLGQAVPDVSPGDKAGVQGPPAAAAAASAPAKSAGGPAITGKVGPPAPASWTTDRRPRTTDRPPTTDHGPGDLGVRRSGGLLGTVLPGARRLIQRFTER